MAVDVVQSKGYLALASRLIRIGEKMRGHTQAFMDRNNVPIQAHHYPLLATLYENGSLTIGELAKNLGVAQPGVTRSVNQLSAKKLVLVKSSTEDQRVRIVELTSHGNGLVDQARREFWPAIEGNLESIMQDQRGDFLSLLDHLEEALNTGAFLPDTGQNDG